jgi:hypothetical protein
MFSMMALAATLVTLYIAYMSVCCFLQTHFLIYPIIMSGLSVWALSSFVVFSFEGALMGGRMSHSVGLENDNSNLSILGWSKIVGDLRVSHFIGMHALQVLPILSFYLLKNTQTHNC